MAVKTKKQSALTYLEALQEIEKGAPAPIYFVYGEERFLHDELLQQAKEKLVDQATADFNFNLFYADSADADNVIAIARSFPMMAQRRIVIVRDMQHFKVASLNKFMAYAKNPVQSTCLILSFLAKSLTQKWAKEIAKNSVAINCRELYDNEIMQWIRNTIRNRKMEIDPSAVQELYQFIGSSLMSLINEINKLEINIAPRRKITLEDVRQITSISRLHSVYDLANAVGEKKMAQALDILQNLLNQGITESAIVWQLSQHFINLFKIKECYREKKTSNQEIQNVTHLHPFFINQMKQQINLFRSDQLRQAISYLAMADFQLKTSYLKNKKMTLEILLYKLMTM